MAGPVSRFHYQRKPHRRQATSTRGLLERNPSAPPQTDDAYDEEYVINNILPHYKFISEHSCLSSHVNQSESETDKNERKANNKARSHNALKQTTLDCLNNTTFARNSYNKKATNRVNVTMDPRTIENIISRHYRTYSTLESDRKVWGLLYDQRNVEKIPRAEVFKK